MNPVCTFDEISKEILKNCGEDAVATFGILIADWQQTDARQYIINYMDRFDKKSGKYIDFYIPGYYEQFNGNNNQMKDRYHPNSYVNFREIEDGNVAFQLTRNQTQYYFSRRLFNEFIEEMETRMGINYTYGPMLLLVEAKQEKNRGMLEFQDRMVIDLDGDSVKGIKSAGILFDTLFEVGKKTVNLERFCKEVRLYYIKGKAIENIVGVLSGEWIKSVASVGRDIYCYRIKHID